MLSNKKQEPNLFSPTLASAGFDDDDFVWMGSGRTQDMHRKGLTSIQFEVTPVPLY